MVIYQRRADVQVLMVYSMIRLITDSLLVTLNKRKEPHQTELVATLFETSPTSGQRDAERRCNKDVGNHTACKRRVQEILHSK